MAWNLDNYEPVADRIGRFRNDYPLATIETDLISDMNGTGYRFKCSIEIDGVLVATGHAEELISTRGVNQAHALENAETSAVGRALANFGLRSVGGVATREDMQNVETRNNTAKQLHDEQQQLLNLVQTFDEDKQKEIKDQAAWLELPSLKKPMSSAHLDYWRDLIHK
jgi:hypothetical protein